MGNTQPIQSIQDNQLSEIKLPFQFDGIPKIILQASNDLGQASFYLVVHFYQLAYLQNNNMMNVSLEELLQSIATRKMNNSFKFVDIRNDEDYKAKSNPQTSKQIDFQALLVLLYFLSMKNQLHQLDINWKSPLPFLAFNEIMNLIASFQNLKSLVLNMPCNQINNPDDQVFLRSFSSRIFCQHNLTILDLTLNFEEYNIDSLKFKIFLTDLSNLQFLEIIILKIESRGYSDISIDSLIVLSLHPSLKSISIQSNNYNEDNNNDALQNKNVSETYLNQLNSSSLQSVYLYQLNTYDLNILFAILTRLPFLMKFSISSKFSTSNTDSLRFPIIPYKRNNTFPVLESIQIMIFIRQNVQFAQELCNGLSQFKTKIVSWDLGEPYGENYFDLRFEKTLIEISQGEIISCQNRFGLQRNKNSDLLNEYILYRKCVCLSICSFKKILQSYMMYNPSYIILDLYID